MSLAFMCNRSAKHQIHIFKCLDQLSREIQLIDVTIRISVCASSQRGNLMHFMDHSDFKIAGEPVSIVKGLRKRCLGLFWK